MALAGTEVNRAGFIRDTTAGGLVVTTTIAGAVWRTGFLRDADGRLVVQYV